MTDPSAQEAADSLPRVIVLSRDLFFGMRIRNALKQMGFATVIRKSEVDLDAELASEPAALVLIDFNTAVEWLQVSDTIAAYSGIPVIAFGPHTDTEAFQSARNAGVTRVISNGAFSQQLPELVKKYASS